MRLNGEIKLAWHRIYDYFIFFGPASVEISSHDQVNKLAIEASKAFVLKS